MTIVVNYEAGNLKSVETALSWLNCDFLVSRDPAAVVCAERLIVPGVGEAGAAMSVLINSGLAGAVRTVFLSGKPMLGICLGCQLIFEHSEEGDTRCLGLLPGKVLRFPRKHGLKVPHMGWNSLLKKKRHPVLEGIEEGSYFYFVHSYYPQPDESDLVLAQSEYGRLFTAAVARDNLVAFQFHPEKSGSAGLRLLSNFLKWRP